MESKDREHDGECPKENILSSACDESPVQDVNQEHATQAGDINFLVSDHSLSEDYRQRDAECTEKEEAELLDSAQPLSSMQKQCETEPTQTQDHSLSEDHRQTDAECTEKKEAEMLDSAQPLSSMQELCEMEPTQTQDHSLSEDHGQTDAECTEKKEAERLDSAQPPSSMQKLCETEPTQTQEQFTDFHNREVSNVELITSEDDKMVNSGEWVVIKSEECGMKNCPTCGKQCREKDTQCLHCRTNEACRDKPEDRQNSVEVICTECHTSLKDVEDSCSKCQNSEFHDAIELPFEERELVKLFEPSGRSI